jgi:monoamine oxidase
MSIDRGSPNWGVQWRDLGFPPVEQQRFAAARERWETAAHDALTGPDRPLSDFIDAADPAKPMIDAISGFANGAALVDVSLHDWAAYEDAAGDENWALPDGYGNLIRDHARPVPMRLATPVTRIDHHGPRLRLVTPDGTIETTRAIVCVPTGVIADAALAFDPPLAAKRDAAAALPLGLADKVFLHVDTPIWPADLHLIGNPHRACTVSHRLSPFGRPIVESFFGGPCAEALEDGDAAAFAIDELVVLLGNDWRHRFTPLAVTRWRQRRWIGGSYSHARIDAAGQRAVLAAPVDDRLFFAGEACSRHDFSTAHGAHATGIAAADRVLALSRRSR